MRKVHAPSATHVLASWKVKILYENTIFTGKQKKQRKFLSIISMDPPPEGGGEGNRIFPTDINFFIRCAVDTTQSKSPQLGARINSTYLELWLFIMALPLPAPPSWYQSDGDTSLDRVTNYDSGLRKYSTLCTVYRLNFFLNLNEAGKILLHITVNNIIFMPT
jgi:hypothetical protein